MEDFEIIEADFQQYYGLDISRVDFGRYARLLFQLPFESRFVQKYSETKDWNWDREVQSRILSKLDLLSCQLANAFKKKGGKKVKPEKQMQPDYVEKAKDKAIRKKSGQDIDRNELEKINNFWRSRNKNIKFLGGEDGQNMARG